MMFEIPMIGAFQLRQSINFGFGQRDARPDQDVMRLGFVLDGLEHQVGAAVRQAGRQSLAVELSGPAVNDIDVDVARQHVARVLSADVDATGWDTLGTQEQLIGRLQAARPGLRPPLFYSAYEALLWSVLSARRPQAQMAQLRDRFAAAHGTVIEVAGEPMAIMPTPEQLLVVESFPSLPEIKLERMKAIAEVAQSGALDTESLRARPSREVDAELQRLPGIGPFYSMLVNVRALGRLDELPVNEPRALKIAGQLLGNGEPLTQQQFDQAAESWRPWRTWATVFLRAAGPLL